MLDNRSLLVVGIVIAFGLIIFVSSVLITGFFAVPAEPKTNDNLVNIIDCNSDLECFSEARITCSPATYTAVSNGNEIKMELLGKENTACKLKMSIGKALFENLSNKGMVCIIPDDINVSNLLELDLSSYCSGELKNALSELGADVKNKMQLEREFGSVCTPKVFWENEFSKYEIIGIEEDAVQKLLLKKEDYPDYPEIIPKIRACHSRFTFFRKTTGKLAVDYWYTLSDDGFIIEYDEDFSPEDIASWCNELEPIEYYFDNGYTHSYPLEMIVGDDGKDYCYLRYKSAPFGYPGIELYIFLNDKKETRLLIETDRGTIAEKVWGYDPFAE